MSNTKEYARDIEIANRYDVTRQSIWRWVRTANFPKPVKLSPGCTRWRIADVIRWEQSNGYHA